MISFGVRRPFREAQKMRNLQFSLSLYFNLNLYLILSLSLSLCGFLAILPLFTVMNWIKGD